MRPLGTSARCLAPAALALGLLGPALGVAQATAPPPTSSNAVNLFLRAGDAGAVATCLNLAAHNGQPGHQRSLRRGP